MVKQQKHSKHRFLTQLRIAVFTALYAGCSTWIGLQADDTEIYVSAVPEAQTPNVLFSIDTSGSMSSNVSDGSQTRMEAVKDALTGLVNNTSNLKAGLGRFHYRLGAPIVFPVTDLDDTPNFLNDTQSVSSIDRSSDDAEEAEGIVTLDDQALEMTEINTGGDTVIKTETFMPIDSSDDDEDGSSGSYSMTSPDLDLGEQDAGVRFRNVTIPKNAVILHAEIEFVSTNNHSNETNVEIFGHDVDSSQPFEESGGNSVNSRFNNVTNASVRWSNIIPLGTGQQVTTPNIRTVVKEIIDRNGWASGNDLTILFEDEGGHREVSTVDGGSAPVLRIQYITSATDVEYRVRQRRHDANENSSGGLTTNFNGFYLFRDTEFGVDFSGGLGGVIFQDVEIPAGADVLWADITWTTRNERDSQAQDMEVYGILESDPGEFTSGNNISARPLTSSLAQWDALLSAGDEEIFAPDDAELMRSPNLEALVEEIRANTAYQSGDNMGFVFSDAAGGGVSERQLCSFDGVTEANGCPEGNQHMPTLRVVYAFPPGPSIQQEIGLRFNNVRVPQGATIESAHLEFTVDATTTEPADLTIEIENNTEPATYSNNTGEKVSDRSYGASTSWTTDIWNTIGATKQSPDISSLVSSVADQSDWCGGGSLAFRITGTTARVIAEAWDKGGSGGPSLRVEYNTDTLGVGEGCTTKQTSVSISDAENDVEEDEGSGSVDFNSGDLDIEPGYLVGLRFEDVNVPKGATVLDANLFLTADENDGGSASIDIRAEQHPNAAPFAPNDNFSVSSRDYGTTVITWSENTDWVEDGIYSPGDDGVNLAPLIADIIDGTVTVGGEEWASGNALVFTLEGTNFNDRDAEVCCGADPPARLDITYQVVLGDTGEGVGNVKVTGREAILSIIDDLVPSGFTPPVDALLEGAYYFNGNDVHFGRTRGAGKSFETSGVTQDIDLDAKIDDWTDAQLLVEGDLSRLSHFATYTPQDATVVPGEGNCTDSDPNNPDCRTEHIDNAETPTYVSPFDGAQACEKGFLVLLSDGIANHNSSRQLIRNLTGAPSCSLDIPEIDDNDDPIISGGGFSMRNPSSSEQCGLELVDYLYNQDFIDELDNDIDVLNNVRTFTIGFNLDTQNSETNRSAVEFLKALAFVGQGGDLSDPDGVEGVQYGDGFFTANTASELELVFEEILDTIIDETTSFVAPGISINAVNRLFHEDEIYYSLFRPDDAVAWLGNLKKFNLCDADQAANDECELGEVVDANGVPAVHTDETEPDTFGTLKTEAQGVWSATDDSAPEINQGGVGELIPTYTARNVYVNTDSGAVTPDSSGDTPDHGTSVHKINLSNDLDSTPPPDPADFNALKTALRDEGNCDSGTIGEQNSCLNDLIEWITGKWFPGDVRRDGTDDDENRWAFGDPMHSRPLILTYGIDPGADPDDPSDDIPLSKIIVGTNDGGVRMINDGNGIEEWIYYPNSMLGMQSGLKDNPNGSHLYGVDSTPTARINDEDNDFIIEPDDGDFVHLYIGMRRGGRELIALNITPDAIVNSATIVPVTPEVLWRIDPGDDPDFQRLGDTWSEGRPARIQTPTGPRTVLVFGGGYNTAKQDGTDTDGTTPDDGDAYNSSTSGDSEGNAIFIVDADTGERLWWASSDAGADAVVPEMNTSIAAPVTLVDTNQDGHVERAYAVDLRGQVFRVDIAAKANPDPGESELADSSVGILAALGPDESAIPPGEQAPNIDRRKFFYAPEVARVNDTAVVEQPYDLVGIISGNRANPQGKTALDRAYVIRDFLIDNPTGGLSSSNFPKCNPRPDATNCPTGPITHSHLKDVTDKGDFVIREEEENGTITLTDPDGNGPPVSVLNDLQQSHGWSFDLEGPNAGLATPPADPTTGEKGFSTATVHAGKMFFTTYLPPEDTVEANSCSVAGTLGTSRFYAVDVFTGAPAFDRNSDATFDEVERFKNIGPGPSSDVTVVNLPGGSILHVPTRQGSTAEDPGFAPEFNRTFWLEDR